MENLLMIHILFFATFIASFNAASIKVPCKDGQVNYHGNLKYVCQNNSFDAISCTFFENNQRIEIEINKTETIDGFWRKCIVSDTSIQIVREPRCLVENKAYHINETFNFNSVVYRCDVGSIEPIGCLFVDSKNKQYEAQLGQTFLIDNIQRRCIFTDSQHDSSKLNVTCHVDGKVYNVGDPIRLKEGFTHECSKDGYITVSGCTSTFNTTLKIGESFIKDGYSHRCIKDNNGVRYSAEPCGNSCTLTSGLKNDSKPILLDSVCEIEGKKVKAGEKYQSSKGFIYLCSPDGSLSIAECVISPGVTIKVGSTLVQNNRLHKCTQVSSSGVTYSVEPCGLKGCLENNANSTGNQLKPNDNGKLGSSSDSKKNSGPCKDEGIERPVGTSWQSANGFRLKCNDEGHIIHTGCIISAGKEISLGEKLIIGSVKYSCDKDGDGASLMTLKSSRINAFSK